MLDLFPGTLIGGLALIAFLWLCLVTPFKSEVMVRIGERKYRDVVSEYKKMTRDRAFGGSAIGLGIMSFLDSRAVLLMERMPCISTASRP